MSGFKLSTVFLLSALALNGLAAHKDDPWERIKPKGSVFTIDLPGSPLVQGQSKTVPQVGKINQTVFHLTSNNVVYMVEDDALDKHSPALQGAADDMLLGEAKAFAKTAGLTIVSADSGRIEGRPSRLMMLQKGKAYFRGFVVSAGTHNIIVLAGASESDINSPNVTRFLSSFRVVNL